MSRLFRRSSRNLPPDEDGDDPTSAFSSLLLDQDAGDEDEDEDEDGDSQQQQQQQQQQQHRSDSDTLTRPSRLPRTPHHHHRSRTKSYYAGAELRRAGSTRDPDRPARKLVKDPCSGSARPSTSLEISDSDGGDGGGGEGGDGKEGGGGSGGGEKGRRNAGDGGGGGGGGMMGYGLVRRLRGVVVWRKGD